MLPEEDTQPQGGDAFEFGYKDIVVHLKDRVIL